MGPEDSNFPEEIPAIPGAGPSDPGASPAPPAQAPPGDPAPEVWSDADGVAMAPDSAEPSPALDLGAELAATTKPASESAPESANWVEAEIPYRPKPLTVVDELLIALAEAVALGRRWLRWLRSQLPAPWRPYLPDPLLTAILLGFGVLLVVVLSHLGGEATPPLVQPRPSPGEAVVAVAEPAPEVPASPTPEQGLIADLETQLGGITRSYTVGLIDGVEVNLPHRTLTIHLGESWYGLLAPQQDNIAQAIYRQALDLGLDRLTLQDPTGLVVARSPVVGSTMVVLQRRRPNPDLPSV